MFEFLFVPDHLRIILTLSMLGLASISDIKKREVSDYVWIIFGIVSGFLIIFDSQFPENLQNLGFSLLVAPFAINMETWIVWRL